MLAHGLLSRASMSWVARRSLVLLLLAGCSPDLSLLTSEGSAGAAGMGGNGGGMGGSKAEIVPHDSNASGAASDAGGSAGAPSSGGDGGAAISDAGAGGVSSAACVAVTESCNGLDDDCNGVVDDGCPSGVSTTFEKDLAALGDSEGGSPFTEDCKDGEALGGATVAVGGLLSQVRGICRTLGLAPSDNAQGGYRVTAARDRALGPHPETSMDATAPLVCPEDEVVIGVRIAQQHITLTDNSVVPVTTRIWLTCAKLVLVNESGKLSVAWQGARELAPASGNLANDTAWLVSSKADAGFVATRLIGSAGAWIDRVGLGVSRLDVVTH